MTKKRKNDIMFYVLVGFVSLILSVWIISSMSIKTQENIILQEQIDSLVYVVNFVHQNSEFLLKNDTAMLQIGSYIPTKRIGEVDQGNKIIMQHAIIFGFISIFVFLYIRCTKFMSGDKLRCRLFKKRKNNNIYNKKK